MKLGGMATFSGVLLKSNEKQVITTLEQNDSYTSEITHLKQSKSIIQKLPIVRGVVSLYQSFIQGVPYIASYSKQIAQSMIKEQVTITKTEITIGCIIATLIILLSTIILPILLSYLTLDPFFRTIIQLVMQLVLFGGYFALLRNIPYFFTLFSFHGAEHMAVNYFEQNEDKVKKIKSILDVPIEEIKLYSKFHKRCGSNYVMFLFFTFLLSTAIIPSQWLLMKMLLEVLLFPVMIGLAYELLLLSSLVPNGIYQLLKPFMIIQHQTTKIPTRQELMAAVISLLTITNVPISLKEFLIEYIKIRQGISCNHHDTLRLAAYVLKQDAQVLFVKSEETFLSFDQQENIRRVLDEYYVLKKPLQYIIGTVLFYQEEYFVSEAVLVPRSDTEILVEKAILLINKQDKKTLLDMCCGSGAIGLSITKHTAISHCTLADISYQALVIACRNAEKLGLTNTVTTVQTDGWSHITDTFDVIVSNPPYIKSREIITLSEYVKQEPILALDGGESGLDVYEKLLNNVHQYLNPNGYLLLEIGYDQKDLVKELIQKNTKLEYLECIKDYGNQDRVVLCRLRPM